MIPQAYITEWANYVPWQTNEQVEQDLVICYALVKIFSDKFLAENLAFRGGTALHKLYLQPQLRYSEDIDLVQISSEPFGQVIDKLRECLKSLGKPKRKQKLNNNTLIYHFDSEYYPIQRLKLKVETNCKEHFSVLGYHYFPYNVQSSWYSGSCNITTYKLEELLGTKLRALYQRKKGRDLFDIYKALTLVPELNKDEIIKCYREYMNFVVEQPPTQKLFLLNMEGKIEDSEFIGDIFALIRPNEVYNHLDAYELVKRELIEKI